MLRVAAAVAIAVCAASQMQATAQPPLPTQEPPAPQESTQRIFDQTFRRLQSYPIPPYAIWTTTWHITATPMGFYTGSQSSVETHRYAVRLSDGMENASDPIPNGKLPPALIVPEFLGPFAWTLRSSVRVAPASSGSAIDMTPDISGLKVIATVVAVAQSPYKVVRSATGGFPIENIEGHQSYHVQLQPRTDPQKHNLRDLWVDTTTYDLRKVHFVGRYAPFPRAPVSDSDVTAYFRNVVGCWVVTRAIWTYDDSPVRFQFDVQNDEIGLPVTLPDWLFDPAAYREHQLAGEPDYIGVLLEELRKRKG